jgi:DNA repair protein RadC
MREHTRRHERLRSAGKVVLSVLLLIALQFNVYAKDKTTAALSEHLQEMKLHMTKMNEIPGTGCKELERHMKQMTIHMEMMMAMMDNMHEEKPDHEMNHD